MTYVTEFCHTAQLASFWLHPRWNGHISQRGSLIHTTLAHMRVARPCKHVHSLKSLLTDVLLYPVSPVPFIQESIQIEGCRSRMRRKSTKRERQNSVDFIPQLIRTRANLRHQSHSRKGEREVYLWLSSQNFFSIWKWDNCQLTPVQLIGLAYRNQDET